MVKDKSDKHMRWSLCLHEFDFELEHVPSKHIVVADNFSRNVISAQGLRSCRPDVQSSIVNLTRWEACGNRTRHELDRTGNYNGNPVQQVCDWNAMRHTRTTPYHLHGNWSIERLNHTLKGELRWTSGYWDYIVGVISTVVSDYWNHIHRIVGRSSYEVASGMYKSIY